jgi:hypothetical protein
VTDGDVPEDHCEMLGVWYGYCEGAPGEPPHRLLQCASHLGILVRLFHWKGHPRHGSGSRTKAEGSRSYSYAESLALVLVGPEHSLILAKRRSVHFEFARGLPVRRYPARRLGGHAGMTQGLQ